MPDGFDLSRTFVHLGLGAAASTVERFEWTPEFLDGYERRFLGDGDEGRLVCVIVQDRTWSTWERHPAGDEVVFLIAGRVDVVQDAGGAETVVELRAGEAMVNPRGVWHRTIVHEAGTALFITPGAGTEHRSLAASDA